MQVITFEKKKKKSGHVFHPTTCHSHTLTHNTKNVCVLVKLLLQNHVTTRHCRSLSYITLCSYPSPPFYFCYELINQRSSLMLLFSFINLPEDKSAKLLLLMFEYLIAKHFKKCLSANQLC